MIIAKKNTAYYLSFGAIDSATPSKYKSGVSPVDTAYSKDGAGVWTALALAGTASEIATTGVYEIDLSDTEMNHDMVLVKFAVSGMADDAYLFDLQAKVVTDLNDFDASADVVASVTLVAATTTVTDGAKASVATEARLSELDQATPGKMANQIDIVQTDTTTDIPAQIAALNDLTEAQVLTKVNEGLDTAIPELSVGIPTATPSLRTAAILQHMKLRNKLDVQTSGTDSMEVHNDAGTLITQKLITDDGTDYSEAKMS